MSWINLITKVNDINEGIQQGKYEMTTDTTHEDFKKFQSFLYRNFKSYPSYDNMRPVSYQSIWFFAAAKTLKFIDYSLKNVSDINLRPITDQSNTFTHNAAKIVSEDLQPLAQSKYFIKTLSFAKIIKYDVLDPDKDCALWCRRFVYQHTS